MLKFLFFQAQNRFRVPLGTKFYRVKARGWDREAALQREQAVHKDGGSPSKSQHWQRMTRRRNPGQDDQGEASQQLLRGELLGADVHKCGEQRGKPAAPSGGGGGSGSSSNGGGQGGGAKCKYTPNAANSWACLYTVVSVIISLLNNNINNSSSRRRAATENRATSTSPPTTTETATSTTPDSSLDSFEALSSHASPHRHALPSASSWPTGNLS